MSEKAAQLKKEEFQAEEDHIRRSRSCSVAEATLLMCEAIQAHKNG